MNSFVKLGAMALGVLALQGCGNSNKATFNSWDSIGPNGTARIDGNVKFASYIANLNTGTVSPGALQQRDGQLIVGLDGAENVTSASVEAGQASVGFNTGSGDSITPMSSFLVLESANGEERAVFADPDTTGFNYQTFGTWLTGYGTGSGVVGTGSFGRVSDPLKGEVPAPGVVTYEGGAGGIAVAADGTPYLIESEAMVQLNIDHTSYAFTTFNTSGSNINTSDPLAIPSNYNLTGSGTLNGSTLVTGTVTSAGGLSGNMEGSLYGPNSEEVGGTYALTGSGSYMGSFGAVVVP